MALAPKINETVTRTDKQRDRAIFNAGYRAAKNGHKNTDNPYFDCEGDAEAWNDGFLECCDEEPDGSEN